MTEQKVFVKIKKSSKRATKKLPNQRGNIMARTIQFETEKNVIISQIIEKVANAKGEVVRLNDLYESYNTMSLWSSEVLFVKYVSSQLIIKGLYAESVRKGGTYASINPISFDRPERISHEERASMFDSLYEAVIDHVLALDGEKVNIGELVEEGLLGCFTGSRQRFMQLFKATVILDTRVSVSIERGRGKGTIVWSAEVE